MTAPRTRSHFHLVLILGLAGIHLLPGGVPGEHARFLAVQPEATGPNPRAPGSFADNPQTWNDGSGLFHSGSTNVDGVGFVSALLDDLASRFAVDARRIFVTGFSNGASMAYRVGAELSGRVAAAAPISGHLWLKDPQPLRPVPLISIAGLADPLNPPGGGEISTPGGGFEHRPPLRDSVLRWSKWNGCPPEPVVIHDADGVLGIAYSPCRQGSEVVSWQAPRERCSLAVLREASAEVTHAV